MLTYTLNKAHGKPMYAALCACIREDIRCGRLAAGERLPSRRALAANLGISTVTVEAAYAQLIAEGYAESRERSGVYVCAIGQMPPPEPSPAPPFVAESRREPPLLDLSGGSGEDIPFPFSVWARTMRAVISEKGAALLHPVDFRGASELRDAIAAHLYRMRGLRVSPEQIVVGAGTEYLYGLLVQLLGRGRRYAVEDPCYPKIAEIYRANDVALAHIPLDREGMSVAALAADGADVAHISPAHHFPTGIVMPARRRRELLQWAYAAPSRYIIEDDYDSELRHSGTPVPPLFSLDTRGRVLYLSTFSQTIAPSLRIAYVCLPPALLRELRERLSFYACAVPTFEQYALARFISSGDYERHLNRLRKRYRDKRALLPEMVRRSALHGRCDVIEENAGTHFLLRLKTALPDAAVKQAARERGLSVRFLSDYAVGDGADAYGAGCMVFNYACLDTARVPAALDALAEALSASERP